MTCVLCSRRIEADDKKIKIQDESVHLHKKCLRKATKKQLVEKGLIGPDDPSWWIFYTK